MPTKSNDNQMIEDISSIEEVKNEPKEIEHKNVPAYPFQVLIPDSFVYPGFKVRDKLSGVEMLVVGFTDDVDAISTEFKISRSRYIYEKIYFNSQKKSDFELFGGDEDDPYYYHFFLNILHSWVDRENISNDLYFVCKFWNSEANDFRYYVKRFFEVESI